MAFAQVTVFRPMAAAEADGILRAVHEALVDTLQVPADDPTVWLTEQPAHHLCSAARHGPDTTLVQVTLFAGRSLQAKHRLHDELSTRLEAAGVRSDALAVVLVESQPENWSTAGVAADQTDLGFRIDI